MRTVLIKLLRKTLNQNLAQAITGEFSRQLKIARVKPLYKKGDQSSFSNYRFTSLVPSISNFLRMSWQHI